MKPHYWNDADGTAERADLWLQMAKGQGYVPSGCQLGGQIVMGLVNAGEDPCAGCECPRDMCHGRPKRAPSVASVAQDQPQRESV